MSIPIAILARLDELRAGGGVVGLAAGDHWHAPHAKLVAVRGRRTMRGSWQGTGHTMAASFG